MPKFNVNQERALDAIDNINFSIPEYFNEFIGGLASEAKTKITIDFNLQKTITTNCHPDSILLSGDDDGFTEDNIKSFQYTYDSNGYGIGGHGLGVRAAFNTFIREKADFHDHFYGIISHNSVIGWTIIRIYHANKDIKKGFVIEYELLNEDKQQDLINLYNIQVGLVKDGSVKDGTLFVIPHLLDDDDKDISEQNYKKILNYRIFNQDLKFIICRKNEKTNVILDYPLCPKSREKDNDYLMINIIKVKARPKSSASERKNKPCDMFRFEPDPFTKEDNQYYHFVLKKPIIYSIDDVDIVEELFTITCELSNMKNDTYFPNHKTDYGIVNLSHNVGYWIMKKKVVVNMEPFGIPTRGEGTGFSPQILYHGDQFIRTEANKSRLKMSNVIMPYGYLLTYIKDSYKIICRAKQAAINLNPDQPNLDQPNLDLNPDQPDPNHDLNRESFSTAQKNQMIMNQYQMKCHICSKQFTDANKFEACHIKSAHNGGTVEMENAFIACFHCNRGMGKKNMMEWISEVWGLDSETYKFVLSKLHLEGKNIF